MMKLKAYSSIREDRQKCGWSQRENEDVKVMMFVLFTSQHQEMIVTGSMNTHR